MKSHFFNVSFVGHLPSLPAGSDAYAEEKLVAAQGSFPSEDELNGKYTSVDANLWRVGPRIATRTFQADVTASLFTGNSSGMGQHKLRYARANLDVLLASGVTLGWTTIVRRLRRRRPLRRGAPGCRWLRP